MFARRRSSMEATDLFLGSAGGAGARSLSRRSLAGLLREEVRLDMLPFLAASDPSSGDVSGAIGVFPFSWLLV